VGIMTSSHGVCINHTDTMLPKLEMPDPCDHTCAFVMVRWLQIQLVTDSTEELIRVM